VAERKRIRLGGHDLLVTQIEITKRRVEELNEYELEDGAVIRVSNPTVVVYRMEDEGTLDWEGNPSYLVKNGTSVIVVSSPQADDKDEANGSGT
jgi:hypothetical protein